eukprot:scaffold73052_cov103-Phaeocystis_antarctica.AAC.4
MARRHRTGQPVRRQPNVAPELITLGCRRADEPRLKCLGRIGRAATDLLVPLASGVRRRSASQGSTASRAGTCATFAAHAAMPLRRVEAGSEAPLSTRANYTIRAKRSIRRATLAAVVVPRCRVSAPAMVLARGEARGGRDDNEQHRRGRRSLPRVVRRRGLARLRTKRVPK